MDRLTVTVNQTAHLISRVCNEHGSMIALSHPEGAAIFIVLGEERLSLRIDDDSGELAGIALRDGVAVLATRTTVYAFCTSRPYGRWARSMNSDDHIETQAAILAVHFATMPAAIILDVPALLPSAAPLLAFTAAAAAASAHFAAGVLRQFLLHLSCLSLRRLGPLPRCRRTSKQ
ncbi:hypothetical protein HPB50_017915 [Hyalomma asiaticum]|uniref:Uncharacterized protein n=1 Tax=Hyalomma asiaticum TaxID=266040 RepID=A0ACB7T961_HYAAI|nr:hypothetical protein HPB50_017915 [Hyalomma asiaticum]